jgi:hypothetical protein
VRTSSTRHLITPILSTITFHHLFTLFLYTISYTIFKQYLSTPTPLHYFLTLPLVIAFSQYGPSQPKFQRHEQFDQASVEVDFSVSGSTRTTALAAAPGIYTLLCTCVYVWLIDKDSSYITASAY